MKENQELLFPELNKARYGESRQHRSLFLPKFLSEQSIDYRLRGESQENAYKIICKWADLELSGKLGRKKETMLEGEFLTQIFGEALDYTLFSKNEEEWNFESKFYVNGGEADAAIGMFRHDQKHPPYAVIELKGPSTNLDRDRFNGRTAVQQCWDYLNAIPQCPWGIVCNYVSFRLYHRNYTPRAYQLFVLNDLRNKEVFRQFYYLFERGGILPVARDQRPRAEILLKRTDERQQEVGDELYDNYHRNRVELIQHLTGKPHNKPQDKAIRIAQKLLDRIIFVAFCEDRGLLPENSIHRAYSHLPPFARVTNPRWQNFLSLFRSINEGNENQGIPPYNGGLFRIDEEVDNLNIDDKWTNFFRSIGKYDFRDEVNVDVLGHLFERSINDIERIKLGGLFDAEFESGERPKMKKSAERKRFGIFYTPRDFTSFITFNVVSKLIDRRFGDVARQFNVDLAAIVASKPDKKLAHYWRRCFNVLQDIKIVDPACGSGAFLISAYDILEEKYQDIIDQLCFHGDRKAEILIEDVPDVILRNNLFGVDLSGEAVEITQLSLWIRSAQRGKTLADLSNNIICGNSLVADPDVHALAVDWQKAFPSVFNKENPGFDCVIGNPPWERLKLQEREFFDPIEPEIASAVSAAARRSLISQLKKNRPDVYKRYLNAKDSAENTLTYIRRSGRFQLAGKGDINTYALFAELASQIVSPVGHVGMLMPSGIATDHTTKAFFGELIDSGSLIGLFDFENKAPIFPDVHRSFKFCVLLFSGITIQHKSADFVFFARQIDDLRDKARQITLSANDIELLNPNTKTCPIFRSRRDAELTKAVYRRVPVLIDKSHKEGGNPWRIKFFTMFHQTNDAEIFHTAEQLKAKKYRRQGAFWKKEKKIFLPLYEAKMIQMYDHHAASVVVKSENWFRQGQPEQTPLVSHQNPEFFVSPRWWADHKVINKALGQPVPPALLAFKNVTSPTNQRTMIAAFIPAVGVINSAPVIRFDERINLTLQCCLLANLNSFVLDYVARQKIGNVNLNFFLIEQFPMFAPEFYAERCPWNHRQTLEKWISNRVLKLTCTSNDMIPLAEAAEFDRSVHKWKPEERANLMAELDAAYFLLYGINRDNTEYILSTFSGVQKEEDGLFGSSSMADRILRHYDLLHEKSSIRQ